MNIQRYFNIAKKLSRKSDHPRYKLGCVIVNKRDVIGWGHNKHHTHPASPHAFRYIHAEFSAILGMDPAELRNSIAFVYRENRSSGRVGIAKPCPSCQRMLCSCGIKRVYFTTGDGYDFYDM